jgi:hypothetical protein
MVTNNACYLVVRVKVTSLSNTPTVQFGVGGGTPSHFSISVPNTSLTAADSLKLGGIAAASYVTNGQHNVALGTNVTMAGNVNLPAAGNVRIGTNGVHTFYSDFSTSVAAMQSGDALLVYGTQVGASGALLPAGLANVKMVGVGNPTITLNITDYINATGLLFAPNGGHVENIRFRITSANLTGTVSHVYGAVFSSGTNITIRNCTFQYETTGAKQATMYANNIIAAPARDVAFDNCAIVSLDVTGSNNLHHVAMHSAGLSNVVFRNCAFVSGALKQFGQLDSAWPLLQDCAANTNALSGASIAGTFRVISNPEAYSYVLSGTYETLAQSAVPQLSAIGSASVGSNLTVGSALVVSNTATFYNSVRSYFANADFAIGTDANNIGQIQWNNAGTHMKFLTREGGTWYDNTLVLNSGSVGIKTNAPAAELDVNGSVIVRTNFVQMYIYGSNVLNAVTNCLPNIPDSTNGFIHNKTLWNSNGYMCIWSTP